MSDWKIVQSIENGISRGIEKAGEGIKEATNEFFRNLLMDSIDILMDIGSTFAMILLIYCIAKFVVLTDKKKREDNANIMVCAGGMLFIFKMLARLAS